LEDKKGHTAESDQANQPVNTPAAPEHEGPDRDSRQSNSAQETTNPHPDSMLDQQIVRWTRAVALATMVLAVTSVATIYILIRTDETARETQRASVFVRDIETRFRKWSGIDDLPAMGFLTVWANGGTTRTENFMYRQACASKQELGLDLKWKKFFDDNRSPWMKAFIGPNAAQTIWMCEGTTKAYLDDMLDRPHHGLFAVGEAKYRDIYGERHYVSFCFEGHITSRDLPDGFFFVPCQDTGAQYNCADGDCEQRP
jgi:hypothetical protein